MEGCHFFIVVLPVLVVDCDRAGGRATTTTQGCENHCLFLFITLLVVVVLLLEQSEG